VLQRKTQRAVQFEITPPAREAVETWIRKGVAIESEAKILCKWKLADPDPRETPPKLILGSCAAYAIDAPRAAEQGTTKTLVFVDKSGAVADVELKQSSGSERCLSAALDISREVRME
jgi:TonB-like protein